MVQATGLDQIVFCYLKQSLAETHFGVPVTASTLCCLHSFYHRIFPDLWFYIRFPDPWCRLRFIHMHRRMDQAMHLHSKQRSNSVKFHRILFYLYRCTITLWFWSIQEIFVLTLKAYGPNALGSMCLECQNKCSPYEPRSRLIRALLYTYTNRPV